MTFENYLDFKIENVASSLENEGIQDIFAFGIGLVFMNDDLENFMLLPMVNTLQNVATRKADASSEEEAAWNYAFWIFLSGKEIFSPEDHQGSLIRDEWVSKSEMSLEKLHAVVADSLGRLKVHNSTRHFWSDDIPLLFCNMSDMGGGHHIYQCLTFINPARREALDLWKMYSL